MDAEEHVSDEALIAAFRMDGMPYHLDMLISRHIGKVRGMLYQMVLHDADADDLTQDVFRLVVRNIEQFSGRATFSTWLYRVTMNRAKSFLKRRQRNPVVYGAEAPEPSGSRSLEPDLAVVTQELDERITEAIGRLRPKIRAAVVLTIIQGVPLSEAARIEGCAIATMYWRVHEARQQLRKLLEEEL